MTAFEIEVREQEQLEKDYADWCRKYDPNYIVERNVEDENLEVTQTSNK